MSRRRLLLVTVPVDDPGIKTRLSRLKKVMGVSVVNPGPSSADIPLTRRQREVLALLAVGRGTREAAKMLGISPKTVETHRQQLMERLGIDTIPGLTRYALQTGLVPPEWLLG